MQQTRRLDGRGDRELRNIAIELGAQRNPEGSVLYRCGATTVLLACSIEESVPRFMEGRGNGWITAEYAMHPRANPDRRQKRTGGDRVDGRSQEIQRLIGRSLRAAVNLDKLGERTLSLDADVLDADGGTRCASVTGGSIALAIALNRLLKRDMVKPGILRSPIAAISVGLLDGRPVLDLPYIEDSRAQVDLNVVGNADGHLIEVQGTAEGFPMKRSELDAMIDLALEGIVELTQRQVQVLRKAEVDLDKLLGR